MHLEAALGEIRLRVGDLTVEGGVPGAEVIEPFTFRDFVVTRPRFASQLCWNSVNDGGTPATSVC